MAKWVLCSLLPFLLCGKILAQDFKPLSKLDALDEQHRMMILIELRVAKFDVAEKCARNAGQLAEAPEERWEDVERRCAEKVAERNGLTYDELQTMVREEQDKEKAREQHARRKDMLGTCLAVALVAIQSPLMFFSGQFFFNGWWAFFEDYFSEYRSERGWASMKLMLFFCAWFAIVYQEWYYLAERLIGD